MDQVLISVAVGCLAFCAIAVIVLPFLAAMLHITYALDGPVITAIATTMLGIITVVWTHGKKPDN